MRFNIEVTRIIAPYPKAEFGTELEQCVNGCRGHSGSQNGMPSSDSRNSPE